MFSPRLGASHGPHRASERVRGIFDATKCNSWRHFLVEQCVSLVFLVHAMSLRGVRLTQFTPVSAVAVIGELGERSSALRSLGTPCDAYSDANRFELLAPPFSFGYLLGY